MSAAAQRSDMRSRGRALMLGLGSSLLACGAPDGPEPGAVDPRDPSCRAPGGVSSRPQNVEQTVALVNALPKPLTLSCFVEALDGPLQLHASLSVLSAQPASGSRSPRIFVNLVPLVLTVVPEGMGAALVEMGEQRPEHRSLKAELSFPITEQLGAAEPFERTLFGADLTACAFCHADETPETQASAVIGYVSQALRPFAHERVSLSVLKDERRACDPALEPERCALLDALFVLGEPVDFDFPEDMATFGG